MLSNGCDMCLTPGRIFGDILRINVMGISNFVKQCERFEDLLLRYDNFECCQSQQ